MSGKPGHASRVTAGGITKVITTSYTRPADTTTYTAGDVVANSTSAATILSFADIASFEGGGGVIHSAALIDSSAESTKPEFDLYLFDTTVVMENDNAAWAPSDAEMETCLGVITFDLDDFKVGSGNGIICNKNIGLPFSCVSGSTTLYGILVARNAYVPTSAEKFTIRLSVLQD